jgi:hypothetical protein
MNASRYLKSARRYLQNARDRFSFNPARGVYQPRSEDENQNSGVEPETPLHVNVRRDHVAIVISFLTLFLLIATVYFTRKQWVVMNATLCQVQKQTEFARIASADATQSMKNAENFYTLRRQRPTRVFGSCAVSFSICLLSPFT